MRTFLILICIAALITSCANSNKKVEQVSDSMVNAQSLLREQFRLINLNDAGELSNEQFKPKADSLKHKIDSIRYTLSDIDKQVLDNFQKQLLEILIEKKVARDRK